VSDDQHERQARTSILFIEQFGVGGLAHYAHSLCQALADRALDVTLLTSTYYELIDSPRRYSLLNILPLWNPWDLQARHGDKIGRLAKKAFRGLRYLWGLALSLYTIWKLRPHIVHLSEMKFLSDLALLILPPRTHLVQTCHNVQRFVENKKQGELLRRRGMWYHAQRLAYRRAHGLIFHADANVDEFERAFQFRPNLWATIPIGEYDLFTPPHPVSMTEARQALALSNDRPLILFFGALRRYKGLHTLLEALVHVRHSIPNAQLVVAGAPLKDVDVSDLYNEANALGIDDGVIWHIEYVPNEKVHLYFRACDVVALPYLKGYDSAVLKIAQTLGLPVVVTDTGGLSAAVDGGRAGVVVPPDNPKALAEGLISLLFDPAKATQLAKCGQELAHSVFSWATVAGQTERLYQQVIAPDGAPVPTPGSHHQGADR
jgi:glycosyltransferase involved in cell wall biosynthesis